MRRPGSHRRRARPAGRDGAPLPALLRLLLPLALAAAPAAQEGAGGPPECFSEAFHLDYYDCCRERTRDGSTSLQRQCFNGQEFTFERCCNFRFGPDIRGLPYTCAWEPDGIAHLEMGRAGPLAISCTHPARPGPDHRAAAPANRSETPTQTIWMSSWLAGWFLVDLDRVVKHCEGTWEEPLEVLKPLLSRPLKILDVGSGTGVLSVAAARAGHEPVAVDFAAAALATTRANMRRNGVRSKTLFWDMTTTPPRELLQQRFDIVFAEVASVATQAFQQGLSDSREIIETMGLYFQDVLNMLILLDAYMFVFIGVYFQKHPSRLDIVTSSLLFALTHYGRENSLQRPCSPGNATLCERVPMMSPKHWLSDLGLAPRTSHAVIVW